MYYVSSGAARALKLFLFVHASPIGQTLAKPQRRQSSSLGQRREKPSRSAHARSLCRISESGCVNKSPQRDVALVIETARHCRAVGEHAELVAQTVAELCAALLRAKVGPIEFFRALKVQIVPAGGSAAARLGHSPGHFS